MNDFLRLILYSVPFTLITIGNATLWLIAIGFRGLSFLLNKIVPLVSFLYSWLKRFLKALSIKTRTLSQLLIKILGQPVKIPHPRLPSISFSLPHLCIPSGYFWFATGVVSSILFLFLPYQAYQFLKALPNPRLLSDRSIPTTTKFFDREGRLLFELFTEQNRTPVGLNDIPQVIKRATIAIEDREFYQHIGFSPRGIARAIRETLLNKRLQGGSTITQQLIKNSLLTPEPTLSRKIKEIILAFWAERMYTKDQILAMYLNQVPYGGTYWGIEAATQGYFAKSVSQLTLTEAAFLAGLPKAPTLYSPFGTHPELAKQRQIEVLNRMAEEGFITPFEAITAKQENLSFAPQIVPIKAPHFVMFVKELLARRYGLRLVEQGGLRVVTSLDLDLQQMAQEILVSELEKLSSLQVGNGAILVTNPQTGEILAMLGSKNYFDETSQGNVNVTLALRQPGSAIKAVTYAVALQNGFTAASILDDSPVTYNILGQPPYSPVNYDGLFHGKLPLRYAFGNSYNVPAVKVLAKIGVATMVAQGRKMGIKSWPDSSQFGLSLTLGGGAITMLDLATVYGTLANGGKLVDLTPILKVTNYKGEVLEETKFGSASQAIPEEVAFIISDILSDNQARSWAFGPNSSLVIPGKTVAVKTGTSNDKRDNWTIGYTPSYTVAVWVGNNDNSPMHQVLTSGITGATPIWNRVMTELLVLKEDEKFPKPENVVAITCFFGRQEYFIKGSEPKGGCPSLVPIITPTEKPQ